MRALALLLPLALGAAAPAPQKTDWSKAVAEWMKPQAPFRVIGNVYYVGTAGIAAYLIRDPKGDILIDGTLPQTADQVLANVEALGVNPEDIRIILVNHAHFDHSGGLAAIKARTGAVLLASAADKPDLEAGVTAGRPDLLKFPPVHVDRVIGEGEHVRLGAIDLETHLTPGHTRGCTSWTTTQREGKRALRILFACSLTVAGERLAGTETYPGVAADFRATFAKLRGLRADVFLNFHPAAFGMEAKLAKLRAGDPLAFVDAGELARRVDEAEAAFEAERAAQAQAGAN